MFWDFITLRPETTHQVSFLFSDRGIPDGYRHMNGYGSHTFKLVNDKCEPVYCKFHYKVSVVPERWKFCWDCENLSKTLYFSSLFLVIPCERKMDHPETPTRLVVSKKLHDNIKLVQTRLFGLFCVHAST